MSWPDELTENFTHEACRFRLVQIAFDRILDKGFTYGEQPAGFAFDVVAYADAVLAEMDKKTETVSHKESANGDQP